MTAGRRPAADAATCRALLESARPDRLDPDALRRLDAASEAALDEAFRQFERAHGAGALPVVEALVAAPLARAARRIARRSLYRLHQRGVVSGPGRPTRAVVQRGAERVARAWLSGIDGSGSRALWLLVEGSFGGMALCSLIVNDTAGILEAAGGDITKKRLARELASLRASQKLPWVETQPARAVALVARALTVHRQRRSEPPAAFNRWLPLFAHAPSDLPAPPAADPTLAARAPELLTLPELAGWFVDPGAVQSDAVELLQARESRLVVSERLKAEREAAIVARVAERELGPDARARWAERLREMAYVFEATDRPEVAAVAHAAAAALPDADPAREPFLVALVRRGLEYAGEVAMGRVRAEDVSRAPQPPASRAAR